MLDHIHPQSKLPAEFELLTKGLRLLSQDAESTALLAENKTLREQLEKLTASAYGSAASPYNVSKSITASNAPAARSESKPIRRKSKAPKPVSTPVNTSPSSMSSAKNAFMSELTGWDLPPKL